MLTVSVYVKDESRAVGLSDGCGTCGLEILGLLHVLDVLRNACRLCPIDVARAMLGATCLCLGWLGHSVDVAIVVLDLVSLARPHRNMKYTWLISLQYRRDVASACWNVHSIWHGRLYVGSLVAPAV